MKKIVIITSLVLTTLSLVSFKVLENTIWKLDSSHAKLSFTVTHLSISDVEGSFKEFQASITTKKSDFSDAVIDMSAKINSISTDNAQRDGYLMSPDFFDASKFTTLEFKSSSFKPSKIKGNYIVKGNLTMHGITKPITLSAVTKFGTNPQNQKIVAGFKISGKINRKDFGIGNSMPSAVVSDNVSIFANAEFEKN